MMQFKWEGIFPALTTPFTATDELDMSLFEKSLIMQLEAGVKGVVLAGSLGEASTLTKQEKEKLVKFSVEKIDGEIPVILNIAEGSTREALKQVKLAKEWGADGLMVLPPMRYNADDRETVQYFKVIADSTDLPIMIYNNPIDYKIEVTLNMFEELQCCSNITAVKESTRDMTNVTKMKNRFGSRYKILCGVDTIAMEELMLGASGWVAGLVCAFPKETVAIYNLVKSLKIQEAFEIFSWFKPLLELDLHAKLVQYIKLAATQTGLSSEYVRSPRLMLSGEEREQVLRIIEKGIQHRPQLVQLV